MTNYIYFVSYLAQMKYGGVEAHDAIYTVEDKIVSDAGLDRLGLWLMNQANKNFESVTFSSVNLLHTEDEP